ncbi:MAG: N-acetyltransferase [Nocardioidaceae bacterium]|nr:N-acetyltransferase [Nocardioidaceae bacterium]
MGWADLRAGAEPVLRDSPAEGDRFGRTVQRMTLPLEFAGDDDAVLAVLDRADADVVVLRYPAARVALFARLLGRGRAALLADQLDYWRLRVGAGRRPEPRPDLVVEPAAGGLDSLVDDLVADIFAGYGNHYLANPLFDPALALAGYQEWARGSARAGGSLVLSLGGFPVALATTASQGDHREIELAGVRTERQGQGLYPHLLAGVEGAAAAAGEESVVISTQVHNTGVRRAWARYGFEPVACFSTVHLVRDGLL